MKNRIKDLRKAAGLTQSTLAQMLGIKQNTLSYWERCLYDIDTSSLQRLADIFSCSIDYILCRDFSTTRVPCISQHLSAARVSRNLSQADLAAMVGVSKNAISNYENGVSVPKVETLLALMSALDVDANYIYDMQPQDRQPIILNDHERSVIVAYRQHPEMQTAVDTLLHLSSETIKAENA